MALVDTRLTSRLSHALAALLLLVPLLLANATAADRGPPAQPGHGMGRHAEHPQLPAPPRPPFAHLPRGVPGGAGPRATDVHMLGPHAALAPIVYPGAPGADNARITLVLYDDGGDWGWLGEAYAVETGNLVSHGSRFAMHPASDYVAGELSGYTGLIYIGSTYDAPLPTALLDDVLASNVPVLWMNDNIWQLSQRAGDFAARYGWSPQYFDFSDTLKVTYKGVVLNRDPKAVPAGLLQTMVIDPGKATVLATIANGSGQVFSWATRGGNLTYIGEIPFSYAGSNDRYLAAVDLIGQVSNPAMLDRRRALVRIEDVGPDADPAQLRAIADYLRKQHVPFSVAVYPLYLDPNGVYAEGTPVSLRLRDASAVVSALRYMQARGGTLLMHGYTHQYSNVPNPYTGVSADDFEFYRAHISTDDYVIYDRPPVEDSISWAQGRIAQAFDEFAAAGFASPNIFEPPHYAASALDYQVFAQNFAARYDRGLYASNWCNGGRCGSGTPDYNRIYGQYFPFLVRDIYGSIVVPESLGNVEPQEFNHNPPRLPADILATARADTVVTDRVQSFYFHPYLPLSNLRTIVEGLKKMGYQFVSVGTVRGG